MLVDIVELDWHGHPLPRDEVLAAVPVRGQISLDCLWTDRDLDRPKVHADIRPFQLETLYSASVRRWKGSSLVLAGWQRQQAPGKQTGGAKFPQRWWVRVVLDPNVPPMSWNERRSLRRIGSGVSPSAAGPCPESHRAAESREIAAAAVSSLSEPAA